VAAAALLVFYIVGVRGKQHVYELAFIQRSQLPAALQEKTPEEGVEVDKAITVVDEAAPLPERKEPELDLERKPALELEEKKAESEREAEEEKGEKIDRRARIAKPVAQDKKDIQALKPTEKKGEARAQVEDAAPSSKMMTEEKTQRFDLREEKVERKEEAKAKALSPLKGQKREKPSLHIADKEKGVAQENVLAEPTPEKEDVEDIVTALGGKIIESEFNEDTQILESLVIQIQADRCRKLIQILEKRGDIQRPYPTIKEKGQEIITIRIRLQQ
jgi:hypothetical protein